MPDTLVETLASYGYQAVFLPRTGFVPPDVYTYKGATGLRGRPSLVMHGPLAGYMATKIDFEQSSGKAAALKGAHTSGKSGGASIDFLSKALACIGVPAMPKGNASVDLGKKIVFSFEDITFERVDPVQIEKVLENIKFKGIPKAQVDDGSVHIAYEYLYARSLMLSREDSRTFEADVAGKLGEWVDLGGGKVKVEAKSETTLSFDTADGAEAPAFAYRSGQIMRQGSALVFNVHAAVAAAGAKPTPYVPYSRDVLTARANQ